MYLALSCSAPVMRRSQGGAGSPDSCQAAPYVLRIVCHAPPGLTRFSAVAGFLCGVRDSLTSSQRNRQIAIVVAAAVSGALPLQAGCVHSRHSRSL